MFRDVVDPENVVVSGFVDTSEVVELIPDVEAMIKKEKRLC